MVVDTINLKINCMNYEERNSIELDHYTYKPLNRVYKWIGFVVFWGAVVFGIVQIIKYVIWANAFIDASLK